jgi:drug/metabolite transporter (DMT)-like permease
VRQAAPAGPGDFLLLGLLALLWGASYLFIRVAVAEIPPLSLIAFRVTGALAVLAAVLALRGQTWPRGRSLWGRLLVQAVFNSIGAGTVLAWGQQYVGAGLASVLNSTAPVFVVLFAALAGRRPGTGRALGCGLGLAGVVLVVGPGALAGGRATAAGLIACVLGAMLYAGAALHGHRVAAAGALGAAAGTMLWVSLVLVPLALAVDRPWRLAPSATALGAAAVLAVFCTGLALLIYFHLLARIGPAATASQSYLRAGVGVLLGVLVLGETLHWALFPGLGLVLAGVVLLNRG